MAAEMASKAKVEPAAAPAPAPDILEVTVQTLTLADGRTLEYGLYGFDDTDPSNASRPTMFHFHGYPSSRVDAGFLVPAALKRGMRVVAPTRPGMGHSTFQKDRRLLDTPADVLALADHLNLTQQHPFFLVGISAGGPHALACWHSLPADRVAGCALASSMFPAKLGMDGMLFLAKALIVAGVWVPSLLGWGMDLSIGRTARDVAHPQKLVDKLDEMMRDASRPAGDRAVWEANEGGIRDTLIGSVRDAFLPGGKGSAWEARLLGVQWGFELGDVQTRRMCGGKEARLVAWHGEEDINVPAPMARKAAAALEGLEMRIIDGEAHASLTVHRAGEILDTLLKMIGEK